jgi:ATP-dependent protease ClpP protease subunit
MRFLQITAATLSVLSSAVIQTQVAFGAEPIQTFQFHCARKSADQMAIPMEYVNSTVYLMGDISTGWPERFATTLEAVDRKCGTRRSTYTVVLDSTGGNVESALALGKILRATTATAYVRNDTTCGSACVFILAGAVQRIVNGNVVIHRPFFTDSTLVGYAERQRRYTQLRKDILKFLQVMNIPTSLLDAMSAVPPDEGHVLSEPELDKYGLSRHDPVWQEEIDIGLSKTLGISRLEFNRRSARAKKICAGDDRCFGRVLLNGADR